MKINETTSYETGSNHGYYKFYINIQGDLNVTESSSEGLKSILSDASYDLQRKIQEYIIRNDPGAVKSREEVITKLKSLFKSPVYSKEVPNEYWNSDAMSYKSPWLMVTTKHGLIRVGWRKRVIEIDWSTSDIKSTAQELFPEENVTKNGRLIHAWSYNDADRYLDRILS